MKSTLPFEIKDFIKKDPPPQNQKTKVAFLSLGNKASFSFKLNLYSLGE